VVQHHRIKAPKCSAGRVVFAARSGRWIDRYARIPFVPERLMLLSRAFCLSRRAGEQRRAARKTKKESAERSSKASVVCTSIEAVSHRRATHHPVRLPLFPRRNVCVRLTP
jgi:hypothetical protein